MFLIRLFREEQSCQKCLFSWEGYAHGCFRGHSVLEKGERIAFVADDLGYLIPRDEHIEIESQLTALGWHQLETCPQCGSRTLFPLNYKQQSAVEVPCISVNRGDLEKQGGLWRLSADALRKFV
jgi:hypothetical protein